MTDTPKDESAKDVKAAKAKTTTKARATKTSAKKTNTRNKVEAEAVKPPKRVKVKTAKKNRAGLGSLAPLLLALGAGAIGGYGGHRLFEKPVAMPDLAPIQTEIAELKSLQKSLEQKLSGLDVVTASEMAKYKASTSEQLTQIQAEIAAQSEHYDEVFLEYSQQQKLAKSLDEAVTTGTSLSDETVDDAIKPLTDSLEGVKLNGKVEEIEPQEIEEKLSVQELKTPAVELKSETIEIEKNIAPTEDQTTAATPSPAPKKKSWLERLRDKHISVGDKD